MFTTLFIVGLTLFGQVAGGDVRYSDPPPTAGQGIAPNTSGQTSPNAVRSNSAPPTTASSGASPNASQPAGNKIQYSAPPPGYGNPNQRTIPLMDASGASPGGATTAGAQPQSPPANLQPPGQTGDPSDNPTAVKPAAMMQAMLSAPRDSQLRGATVRLIEVINSGRMRNDQTQRVEAYWDLCASAADYYLSLREQDELRKLGAATSAPGAAWQQMAKEMDVRIGTSLRAAKASQFRLAGFMGRGSNNLPLPADLPHCGSYTTHHQEIFSNRNSPEAQELAALLGLRYAELKDASAAVTRAEEWLDRIVSRSENLDGDGNMRALELLALRRRAFVQIARDYNRRIARYTELAAPGQIGADRLTGMLIRRANASTATRSSSPVPHPNRQTNNADGGPPRTFAEEWSPSTGNPTGVAGSRDGVQPASGIQPPTQGDRSLLVAPPR